jgi:hypothetical protein
LSFAGATSGVWATTASGDSAAVFGGSRNPVQDTEIVVFQNHAKAVAYANLGTDPNAGGPDPDHQTILGTNWAVDAATPAAPGIRAALGGTLIPNVPASAAPAATTPAAATAASDTQVCNDVNTWESNNDGQAATAFGTDDASTAIVTEASGSSAVDSDVQNLSGDTGSSAATDISSLTTDCATAGVTLTGSDFTQAAATPTTAPSTTAPAAVPSTPAPSTPAMSIAEQQAVTSAQGYLDLGSGFSYQSLLKQLTSSYGSGFSTSDAEFAINYLKPDWDAQAVEAAQGYLKLGTGFSRSSLIQQLTSSYGNGFTEAQAEYAVSKVGL